MRNARTASIVSGFGGRLVVAVPAHPREPQRDATGVTGRLLHTIERDLDDQFRPHVDGDPFLARRECLQTLGLPG
jgi:hypothetical protein